jgi:DNA-binding LacI/PurR family transcriptional regulator
MRKSQVTAQQVARRAGVSQTTVSFVLNNVEAANISRETQERVRRIATEMGYVPDVAARTLARGKSSNIGLVLINPHDQIFTDPYIPNIIRGLDQTTKTHGFRILVEQVYSLDGSDMVESLLRGGEVAGVIINGLIWGDEAKLFPLIEDGYPLVTVDLVTSPPLHRVTIDHVGGVRQIVSHLVGLGHRRIACITYGPSSPHVQIRLEAYRQVLEANGIPYDPDMVRMGAYEPESGYQAMQSLLALDTVPSAVYGMNDIMALGAMAAIHDAGLRVPGDIAVVGYDDMRFAQFTYPPLTTVRAPEIRLGYEAGKMLINLINRVPIEQKQFLLPGELIVRESCGSAARSID